VFPFSHLRNIIDFAPLILSRECEEELPPINTTPFLIAAAFIREGDSFPIGFGHFGALIGECSGVVVERGDQLRLTVGSRRWDVVIDKTVYHQGHHVGISILLLVKTLD
jgi:hypothetical protein